MIINDYRARDYLGKLSYAYIISELYKNKVIKSSSFTSVYNGSHLEKKLAFYVKTRLKHILNDRDSFLSNCVERLSINYGNVYLDFNIKKYLYTNGFIDIFALFFSGELTAILEDMGAISSNFINISPKAAGGFGLCVSTSFVHEINEFLKERDTILQDEEEDPEVKHKVLNEGYIFEKISNEIKFIANIDFYLGVIFDYFEKYIDKFIVDDDGRVVPKDDFSITFSNLMRFLKGKTGSINNLCAIPEDTTNLSGQEDRIIGCDFRDMYSSLELLYTYCKDNPDKMNRFMSDAVPDCSFSDIKHLAELFTGWGSFRKNESTAGIVRNLSTKVRRFCASIREINV